ncbi:tyrosine-type recombinase/integrase [Thiorhodococcus minor]|uniref:Tyrosine-type recombinase/integrase n=1 Tax=Thiorhodococcus minor TaxID=57489 RepID=A0A6M0K7K3_9GAMM|nr:tyrosine-type recombinase/integrase [Thiorhodococcus minor]NEV65284.1 tyrosine-type recombinase/integrase [Thiorhodococcus minor]
MNLPQVVHDYVALKQSMGSRFRTEAAILKAFCKAVGDVAITDVEPQQVARYLAGSGPVTRYWHRKYEALTGFYRFALGRGYVALSPLPKTVPQRPEPFRPYIFPEEELRRLFKAAGELEAPRMALQGATLRPLLLLLYGTGLRISEALALTLADVDLGAQVLTIRESKFYKTRLVPIGPRLAAVLRTYAHDRHRQGHANDPANPFFVTRTDTAVTRGMVESAFVRLRNSADIAREDGARYQPRLHDLRHHADNRIMPSRAAGDRPAALWRCLRSA